ncbi:MAG: amidohydrolase family protein [Solirubrobacterales bacterium]
MKFPIIDFHAHISSVETFNEFKGIKDDFGINKAVLVSGNMLNPSQLGDFLRGTAPLNTDAPNNDYLLDILQQYPDDYAAFFTIDPNYHVEEDLAQAMKDGFWGFKLNTVVHKVDFGDSNLMSLLSSIESTGCPVYTHITLNPHSSIEAIVSLARKYKKLNFVIGHMGFSASDFAAITAAQTNDNIFLESSIGSRLAFLEVRKRGLIHKLLFGSEFPAHDPRIEFEKLKYVFNEAELEAICYRNTESLLSWRGAI